MILITGGASSGKHAYAREHFPDREVISDYEKLIREQMKKGIDPLQEAEKLSGGQLVVILAEIGSGLVPLDREERIYRETVGRCGCIIASHAEQVIRVTCGIGVRIR
ncbi:MAG: bifunctional adenosylcobinamide kinase/adenosylcobinamide-phosphate guanylyltransferase [Lachnospiraceae bacterium]|nr:bifunctional adenosylcobinamide kinase/adenosylcobinamide-phosphate guanylyltransferase [Lachnospiraceae bacterium]